MLVANLVDQASIVERLFDVFVGSAAVTAGEPGV
jgi:hypothetical protein